MKHGRKITGGKYHARRKLRAFEKKKPERKVILSDETKRKILRGRGGSSKATLLRTNIVNISTAAGKVKQAKITNVEETPQNRFLARQNVLFKGAVISTSLGKARITNRPSQEGQVNAILIKE